MSRHTKRSKAPDEGLPPLPITPMLDMSFQLLLFLIPFFKPMPIEGQVNLNLPAKSETKAIEQQDVDPKDGSATDGTVPSEVTVIVSTSPSGPSLGMISRIVVRNREKEIAIPEDARWEAILLEELKRLRNATDLGNKDDVSIKGDRKLKYDFIMKVMDVCERAGFKGKGFAPPPDAAGG